jgi:lipopolysaccharide export system permease protein
MTLTLYIARRFVLSVGQVLLSFLAILVLIDMIEQLRKLSDRGVGLAEALRLSLFNVPESLYAILPLIFVMGSIALFLSLARSSELVVVRAAGPVGPALSGHAGGGGAGAWAFCHRRAEPLGRRHPEGL